jgi:ssDNA-binding Zn-finger/Zn-ribbon topoisomerase 1
MPDNTTQECPLCGGTMQLRRSQAPVHVPGNPKPTLQITSEWMCPDCDYFEEAEEEGT